MKSIWVKNLKPGMAFTKPVFIDKENILVKAGEVISESDIARLTKWSIKEVFSDGEPVVETDAKPATGASQAEQNLLEASRKALKHLIKEKPSFDTLMADGERVIGNVYEYLARDTATQISPVRTTAERIVNLVDSAPGIHIFTNEYLQAPNLYRHAMINGIFATELARGLEFSTPRIIEIVFSILLMDVGMMKLSFTNAKKDDVLTEAEKQQMHTHPVLGYQVLMNVGKIKASIAQVALQHHEHFDGTGYPRKTKGADMSEGARIASIVDSYTAILEHKTYRNSKLPYEAMRELLTLGIYRYDPVYLKAFLNRLSIYPVGSLVELSELSLGIVVGSVPGKPMRPVILVVRQPDRTRPNQPTLIPLLYRPELFISKALDPLEMKISVAEEIDIAAKKL